VFRLDSAYRTWIHSKNSLFAGEGEHLIEFRKRELRTALGTAKWQVCVIAVKYLRAYNINCTYMLSNLRLFGSFPKIIGVRIKYVKYVKYST
jgi:hypothetical protein